MPARRRWRPLRAPAIGGPLNFVPEIAEAGSENSGALQKPMRQTHSENPVGFRRTGLSENSPSRHQVTASD